LAAKAATTTIPIVFTTAGDPVQLGLVASLNRPGGNITGVSFLSQTIASKRLELLRELIPTAALIGYLNPDNPTSGIETRDAELAARALGLEIHVVIAHDERDFDQAFATFVQRRVDAMFVGGDPIFLNRRDQIVALTARHAIPAIYNVRQWPVAGGLISYGGSLTDAFRQAAVYTGRILKGDKPADLPVQQSTRVELVINLKTANTLRLKMPDKLLALADEVIE
jgi:putative ABC transport system substrate-binding protein